MGVGLLMDVPMDDMAARITSPHTITARTVSEQYTLSACVPATNAGTLLLVC